MVKNVIIMGAAGRDFHNFNVFFRDNKEYKVVAFTATQIPGIEGRRYPKELAGKRYPKGVPIYPEEKLVRLIKKHNVDEVVFSYSDVSHEYVMHKAAIVNAAGATFSLLGVDQTMLASRKPVISVCAVRTGCGKSQTTRYIADLLKKQGKRVVVIRHPMPYGNLVKQAVQRFATYKDLDKHRCTIEEREEYEPHIARGFVVYAGVDYEKILRQAEKEADVILWDGGNNDTPFYKPNLHIVVADPHRVGHETKYYPGETNLRMADVVIINKEDSANKSDIEKLKKNIKLANSSAKIVDADSPLKVVEPGMVRDRRVLVVEDGPTLTHGGMQYGAGVVAAKRLKAKLVDPRPYVVGSIRKTFRKYDIGVLLPAMGYGKKQVKELERTINKAKCDSVLIATPIDLGKLIKINKPHTRVFYELKEKKGLLKRLISRGLRTNP